jgi:hypothetical protein
LRLSVKPFKLSRQRVKYVFGASIQTRLNEYKEGEKTHKGIPSTLIELPPAQPQNGTDENGMYTEIVVPQDFEPGSIMVFATELEVSGYALSSLFSGSLMCHHACRASKATLMPFAGRMLMLLSHPWTWST